MVYWQMISWRGDQKSQEVTEALVSKAAHPDFPVAAALVPIGHNPLPLLPFEHLGIHRAWGQLRPGGSVFAFLPVEQISLEKAGEVALIE